MAEKSVRVVLSASVAGFTAGMEKAAAATGKVAERADRLTKSDKWRSFERGAMGASVAAVGAMGMAVARFAEFDEAMSRVGAATGSSAAEMDKLREAAMAAGAEFGQFSSTEAAAAIEELGKAGLSTAQIVGGGLTGALALAAADGMAVAEAAELTADALAIFNLDGSKATRVADLLAQGAGAATGSARDLGMALAQAGAVAASTGLSIDDTTTALALFAKNGIKGSDAGTSLKSMLTALANPSAKASKLMGELGINAFDAQGAFIGMRELSEQLNVKLADLSTEQRNAALATIFGSDAMRVASIAAKEGGKGYDAMVQSMAGYGSAAEQAAKRTDNLKGDLAELSGAWENFMISLGGSGDGPLRKAVQGLTGLTEWASRHKTTTGILLGTTGAMIGLAAAAVGVVRTIQGVRAFHAAWKDLPKLEGNMKRAAVGAGVLTAAFAALTVAGAAYQRSIDKQMSSLPEMEATLRGLSKGGDLSKIDEDFAQMGTTVKSLGDALDFMNAKSGRWNKFSRDAGKLIPSVLGMKSATTQYTEQLDKLDKALAAMDTADAAAAFTRMVQQSGRAAQDFAPYLDDYRNKLIGISNELNVQVSESELVDWMGGKVPAAVDAAAKAARAAGRPVSDLADKNKMAAESAKAAAQAAQDQRDAYLDLANTALQLSGSQIGVQKAIDDAAASLKENGRTLDINTEKGRANRSALDGIASSALALIEAQQKNGASAAELTKTTQENRDAFINTAVAMGMGRDAAAKLADQYGLIPKEVATKFSADTKSAEDDLNGVAAAVGAIPSVKIITIRADNRMGALGSAIGLPMQARATGGPIYGPGTKTSDDVPIWASRGEFMQQASAVDYYGQGVMWALNQKRIPREFFGALGLAGGGPVSWSRQPVGSAGMTNITNGGATFAPTINAYGPDAQEVAGHAMARMQHQMRAMAVVIPGGAA